MAVAAGWIVWGRKAPTRFWLAACVVSVLPDADAFLHWSGVPYGDDFGHRGFFHSLFFAALCSTVAVALLFRKRWASMGLVLLLVGASHGLLDAMTDGGLGTAFFAPFDATRYFLPWRPLAVGPIAIRPFFSEWGVRVLASEFLVVWLPLVGLALITANLRRPATNHG